MSTSKVLKALSHPFRVRIMGALRRYEGINQTQVVDLLGVTSQPLARHHCEELRYAGLITATNRGREVVYRLNRECDAYEFAAQVLKLMNKYQEVVA
jgi:DNA-binding transcriptional ArsR family regulator